MTTKAEVIATAAETAGLTKSIVTTAVNAFLAQLGSDIISLRKVQIDGLGVFEVKDTAAKVGRNPRTGEPVDIPAGRKISFRPSKSLKDKL